MPTRVATVSLLLLSLCAAKSEMPGDVHIWEPARLRSLYAAKPLEYSIANFGTVPYGHSIYGTVFKATPLNACAPLSSLRWDKNSGTMIIFVERGECHFAEKVLAAQKAGAGMVIIGDTADEDVRKIMPVERTVELINKIHIPSILINREDTEHFKRVLEEGKDSQITMAVDFQLVKHTDRSHIKMILQTDDFRSYEAVAALKGYYKPFRQFMELTFHYKVFKNVPLVFDPANCVKGQDLYCVLNSSGKKGSGLLGETLRQICVLAEGFEGFAGYMEAVRRRCFRDEAIVDEFAKCTAAVFEQKFSAEQREGLAACLDPAGEKARLAFEANNEKVKYSLINYSPLIFINGYFYKGNYQDSGHLMEAFCNSFESPPAGCNSLAAFQQYVDFSSSGVLGFVFKTLLAAGFFTIVGITAFYFVYRKKMKGQFDVEMNKRVNEALSKYYAPNVEEYRGVAKD